MRSIVIASFAILSLVMCVSPEGLGNASEKPKPAAPAEKAPAKGDKAKDKRKPASPAEKFLLHAEEKLDAMAFDAADLAAAERFAREARAPEDKLRFRLLLARYQREYAGRPDRAAAEVLPFLLAKERVAAWEKEGARLAAAAKAASGKTAPKDAAPGGDKEAGAPQAAMAPLPPAGEWEVTALTAPAAVEAAACLAAAGKVPEAMAAAQRVGREFKDVSRVLAVEVAGDANMTMDDPAEALRAYEFAIKYINETLGAKVRRGENYVTEHSAGEKRLRARLERKRDRARRAAEAAMYGPDWSLYRDATRDHWERRSPAEALLKYRELIAEYPDTVYAEAARCYAIKCLLALADEDAMIDQSLRTALRQRKDRVDNAHRVLALALRNKTAEQLRSRLRHSLENVTAELKALEYAPKGDKALKQAVEETNKFLVDKEYGLYRGEALVALADFYLERRFNALDAKPLYEKAVVWFEKIRGIDNQLKGLRVPDKARAVAAVPKTMRRYDQFGNTVWENQRQAGKVFNRRNSEWYIDFYSVEAIGKLSLCRYLANDIEGACDLAEKLGTYDQFEKQLRAAGEPNYLDRLTGQYRRGYLYTEPEFMKDFRGDAKVGMTVCDYYTTLEQWGKGMAILRRLHGYFPSEQSPAKCYLYFVEGKIYGMLGDNGNKEIACFQKAASNPKAAIWEIASLTLANELQYTTDGYNRSAAHFKQLLKGPGSAQLKENALYSLGELSFAHEKYAESARYFTKFLEKYPHSEIARAARSYLEEIKQNSTLSTNIQE